MSKTVSSCVFVIRRATHSDPSDTQLYRTGLDFLFHAARMSRYLQTLVWRCGRIVDVRTNKTIQYVRCNVMCGAWISFHISRKVKGKRTDRKGPGMAAQHFTMGMKITTGTATEHNRHLMSFTATFPITALFFVSLTDVYNNRLSFKSHPLTPPVTSPVRIKPTKSNCMTLREYAHPFGCACFVFPVPTLNRLYTNIIFPFIFPPSLNWSKCLCARCGFFPAVTDKRPFNSVFPLAQQGRTLENVYPHILLESVRAHTNTHTLGCSFLYFPKKLGATRVPASSFLLARVCCSSSISFSTHSLKKKTKLSTSKGH